MIYIYVVVVALIFVGAILSYALGTPAIQILDTFTEIYPEAYAAAPVAFLRAVIHWMPFIILVGGLLFVYVASQRSRTPEGYY